MIRCEIKATVTYTRDFKGEEARKIKVKARELSKESPWLDEEDMYTDAIEMLWAENKLDLYEGAIESDFATKCIEQAYEEDEE